MQSVRVRNSIIPCLGRIDPRSLIAASVVRRQYHVSLIKCGSSFLACVGVCVPDWVALCSASDNLVMLVLRKWNVGNGCNALDEQNFSDLDCGFAQPQLMPQADI